MHNSPAVSSAKSFDLTSTAFLIVAFLTGIAGALQTPTLSIFLTDEVHARPAMVGFFFTGSAVIGILVSQFLAGIAGALQTPTLSIFLTDEVHARPAMVGFFFTGSAVIGILVSQFLAGSSDKRGDRKSLIVFCCLLGVLACTLFAWNRNYFVLLFVGVFLSSFGSTANPQMFALAREHADKTGREAVMFSSFLRAQVSLAWVIGPPLAYALAMGFSFTVMYLSAAVAFIVCGVMVWLFLPSMQKELLLATGTIEAPRRNRRDTLLLFVICTLMWGSNSLYIINMPLFIINELHLPEKLAGVMMGTAAGLEIPTMLIAGYFAKRLGKRFLMRVAAVGGVCFYAGMLMAHSPVILLGLQLLNAIFIGILGGIGMLYFQDLMPGQAGSATTLYTNTSRVGWIIAGSVAGIVAEIWNYHAVFWFAMVMIIATLFCLLRIKDV
ncbi:sugar efflux transporter SetB [Escherichia coli]|nr:sugar efflux transporter SetB [Escherichia coli]